MAPRCDFPIRVFLKHKSKMTHNCDLFRFLRRNVEGKHLLCFQSENIVFKFLSAADGLKPQVFIKNALLFLNRLFSPESWLLQGHISQSHTPTGWKKHSFARKLPSSQICHKEVCLRVSQAWLQIHGNPTWRLVCIRTACS